MSVLMVDTRSWRPNARPIPTHDGCVNHATCAFMSVDCRCCHEASSADRHCASHAPSDALLGDGPVRGGADAQPRAWIGIGHRAVEARSGTARLQGSRGGPVFGGVVEGLALLETRGARASSWAGLGDRSGRTRAAFFELCSGLEPVPSPTHALVAQLDRAPGFEPGCRRFKSFRARHTKALKSHRRF